MAGLASAPATGLLQDQANYGEFPSVSFGGGLGIGLIPCSLTRLVRGTGAGVNPGATGADNVLASYVLPAGSLDGKVGNAQSFRGLRIVAGGLLAATANTKTLKLFFAPDSAVVGSTVGSGGSTLVTSGALTGNNQPWWMDAVVFKAGAAGSNTQYAQAMPSWSGVAGALTFFASTVPIFPTAAENAAINVAVTGNAATAATDIALHYFEVWGLN